MIKPERLGNLKLSGQTLSFLLADDTPTIGQKAFSHAPQLVRSCADFAEGARS